MVQQADRFRSPDQNPGGAASRPRARPCILHVDDDRDVLALVARELGPMADVISADSVETALRILAGRQVDLVVLDIGLGQDSGLDLLPDLRDRAGNMIPVIIFSVHAGGVTCDEQVDSALSKMDSPLESLGTQCATAGADPGACRVRRSMLTIRILHIDDEPDIREIIEISLGLDPAFTIRSCDRVRKGWSLRRSGVPMPSCWMS